MKVFSLVEVFDCTDNPRHLVKPKLCSRRTLCSGFVDTWGILAATD